MPELGIIGFERSGKTSLHNAVTGADHEVGFTTHSDPHLGVVKVPDTRLDQLSVLFTPKKTTPADLQYVDFPGAGFGGGGGPDPRFLTQLSQMDALIHVVRAFEEESIPHPEGSVDPARDIETMTMELTFADLGLVEKRLERIASDNKAAKPAERDASERDAELLRRIQAQLGDGIPVRAMTLSEDDRKDMRHYRFLTDRPLLTLLNIGEADTAEAEAIAAQFRPAQEAEHTATAALCASLEMELRGLSVDEADEYRRGVGAGEDALTTAIRLSYAILGLRSFFTVGEDECRAWTIHEGDNAQQAAGRIHTDLERGFIRAEVVAWDNLLSAGSEAEAKKRAQLHTEGKDYIVQDGDILHVLFNL
jgi:GTP-binding protein YchF